MNSKLEIKKTADGSNTIFLPDLNENYHSFHGAIQEAKHVFIQNGLENLSSYSEISIFELGLGTGLNAYLTSLWAERLQIRINYTSIEAFPVPIEICNKMDYPIHLKAKDGSALYEAIINSNWNQVNQLSDFFFLHKIENVIQDWSSDSKVDLIFFDAFGPRAQPEMWDLAILDKMYNLLKNSGVLVTYCAQGQFRRNLKSIGFKVDSLPGPPGKREMTRAIRI